MVSHKEVGGVCVCTGVGVGASVGNGVGACVGVGDKSSLIYA